MTITEKLVSEWMLEKCLYQTGALDFIWIRHHFWWTCMASFCTTLSPCGIISIHLCIRTHDSLHSLSFLSKGSPQLSIYWRSMVGNFLGCVAIFNWIQVPNDSGFLVNVNAGMQNKELMSRFCSQWYCCSKWSWRVSRADISKGWLGKKKWCQHFLFLF